MKTNQKTFKNQEDAVAYVKELSGFYKQVAIYVMSNVLFILYWLLAGEGYFWPIWVILGWGTPLFFVAVDLQILPKSIQKTMNSILEALPLPFLRPEWEKDQLDRILKKKSGHNSQESLVLTKTMAEKAVVKKASVPAKKSGTAVKKEKATPALPKAPAKPKAAPKKAPAKKAAPKKAAPKKVAPPKAPKK